MTVFKVVFRPPPPYALRISDSDFTAIVCLRRMLTIFPHAERDARMFDLLETVKVIIWQTLVPTPDGQRTALREYLVITEEVRDILIDGKTDAIVSRVRKILSSAGKPLIVDAKEKYEAGTIDKKVFDLIEKHRGGG